MQSPQVVQDLLQLETAASCSDAAAMVHDVMQDLTH